MNVVSLEQVCHGHGLFRRVFMSALLWTDLSWKGIGYHIIQDCGEIFRNSSKIPWWKCNKKDENATKKMTHKFGLHHSPS